MWAVATATTKACLNRDVLNILNVTTDSLDLFVLGFRVRGKFSSFRDQGFAISLWIDRAAAWVLNLKSSDRYLSGAGFSNHGAREDLRGG
jgi:hypothetical protein